MKVFFAALMLISSARVFAYDFTLNDEHTGRRYYCSEDPNGGTTNPDPTCARRVTDYCSTHTGMTGTECFVKASDACSGTRNTNFVGCISETTSYCSTHTGMSSTECFTRALTSCR